MSEIQEAILAVTVFMSILATPFIYIYLTYTVFWHRWRNHKYRMIQVTTMSHYNDEVVVKYLIQRKGIFGWRDNPEIPSYDDGKLAIYRTHPYKSIEECQNWMDRITAVLKNDGRKENPII